VALLLSMTGIALATFLSAFYPDASFTIMMAISMFGALFTWTMIFVTHYFFRRHWTRSGHPLPRFRMWGFPVLTLLGAALALAVTITTLFTPAFRMTLVFGVPFLTGLSVVYFVGYRHRTSSNRAEAVPQEAR
jgi:L-asparagine transporter-like permease